MENRTWKWVWRGWNEGHEKMYSTVISMCIRKLINSMLNKRLIHRLESQNILAPNFYADGFRSGRSTLDAVNQIVLDIHSPFIKKEHLIASFLEIESAYPNVHFPTLSNCLYKLNLPPPPLCSINILNVHPTSNPPPHLTKHP